MTREYIGLEVLPRVFKIEGSRQTQPGFAVLTRGRGKEPHALKRGSLLFHGSPEVAIQLSHLFSVSRP